jgi:DNA ligase-associated metallophosphoesterase
LEVERLNRLPAIRPPYPPQKLEISTGVFLDSRRAIWIEREKTLAVADLHLGFAWAHRAEGNLLPLSKPEDTVARLCALAAEYPVHTVLVLGDIVHRAVPIEPVRDELRRLCSSLPDAELQLIAGNHDRALELMLRDCKIALPLVSEACIGPHTFLHGDKTPSRPVDNSEGLTFIGHEHPAIRLGDGISSIKCPCFLIRQDLIVLPAFSSWAAGSDARSGHFLSPLAKSGKFTKAVAILAGKLLPVPL